jgi:hypothetical protein
MFEWWTPIHLITCCMSSIGVWISDHHAPQDLVESPSGYWENTARMLLQNRSRSVAWSSNCSHEWDGQLKPLCMQLLLSAQKPSPSHCGCLSDYPQLPWHLSEVCNYPGVFEQSAITLTSLSSPQLPWHLWAVPQVTWHLWAVRK